MRRAYEEHLAREQEHNAAQTHEQQESDSDSEAVESINGMISLILQSQLIFI